MSQNDTNSSHPKEGIPETRFWTESIQLSIIRTLEEGDIRERAFYLNSGHVIYGICVGELTDSFLVGLSCSFYRNEDGQYEIHETTPHQVIRLFKNSITMLGFCTPTLREVYFKYLLTLPSEYDLITPERKKYIQDSVFIHTEKLRTKVTESTKKPETFEEVPSFMKGYSTVKH